jgi:hypothetical protein
MVFRVSSTPAAARGLARKRFRQRATVPCRHERRRGSRGGLAPDYSRWIDLQQRFFLPVDVLREVFRGKFVDGLRKLHTEHRLGSHGPLAALQNPKAFAAWLRPLFRSPWVVYAKRPFGGAQHALRYLGQYTHRVAISNHRLVALTDGMVTFRWRDSAHKNKKRLMTLPVDEFLRRFLLHVLPKGFVRIRHFGFQAHRHRGALFPLCLQLLADSGRVAVETRSPEKAGPSPPPLWTCPQCGGPMVLIERLSHIELRLRSPPAPVTQQP